jgi:hypothetical protein
VDRYGHTEEPLPSDFSDEAGRVSELFYRPLVRLLAITRESPMMGDVDVKAMQRVLRTIDAAIRLRSYYEWETEVLHDEGTVLGVKSAGGSEGPPLSPKEASVEIGSALDEVSRRIGILRAQAEADSAGQGSSPERVAGPALVTVQPGTAFIIMAINRDDPGLEDVKTAIQEEFARFNIRAIRADDIEHSEEITHRVLEAIKSSEFLIADLSGERPSVYYEFGYAHAIGKRPIPYRKEGTKLHFDLVVHNCPEYSNLRDLKAKLNKRLSSILRGE